MTGPFAAHPGTRGKRRPPLFRLSLRLPWRKQPAPAAETAGTATALLTDAATPPGPPGARPGTAPRKVLPRHDGQVIIDQQNRVSVVPWPPAPRPARPEPPWAPRPYDTSVDLPVARPYVPQPRSALSFDCGNGCHAPLCDGRNCSCDCHRSAA